MTTHSARLMLGMSIAAAALAAPVRGASPVPLVYITDLYHSPGDPDDHVDLATLLALPEFDIRALLIDVRPPRRPDGYPYDPGFIPVSQLCYLTGRSFPVAVGPAGKLRSLTDDAVDRPESEQAGIRLLLEILRQSPEPVLINTTGTCRMIAAAFLREPDLLRAKVKAVVVNAGSSAGGPLEHNVAVDPRSYVITLRSGLPILWFPCAGSTTRWGTPGSRGPNNTFFRVAQKDLYAGLPGPLRNWFAYALGRSKRADILSVLTEETPEGNGNSPLDQGQRNLWSTASLVLTSGRQLVKLPEGWRFVPRADVPPDAEVQHLAVIPVALTVTDNAQVTWSAANGDSRVGLFERRPGPEHTAAMAEALNALLQSFPCVR